MMSIAAHFCTVGTPCRPSVELCATPAGGITNEDIEAMEEEAPTLLFLILIGGAIVVTGDGGAAAAAGAAAPAATSD